MGKRHLRLPQLALAWKICSLASTPCYPAILWFACS